MRSEWFQTHRVRPAPPLIVCTRQYNKISRAPRTPPDWYMHAASRRRRAEGAFVEINLIASFARPERADTYVFIDGNKLHFATHTVINLIVCWFKRLYGVSFNYARMSAALKDKHLNGSTRSLVCVSENNNCFSGQGYWFIGPNCALQQLLGSRQRPDCRRCDFCNAH